MTFEFDWRDVKMLRDKDSWICDTVQLISKGIRGESEEKQSLGCPDKRGVTEEVPFDLPGRAASTNDVQFLYATESKLHSLTI
jgi:hypothetical protein